MGYRVLFLASEDAMQPYDDEIPYCATKAGILALSKGLTKTLTTRNYFKCSFACLYQYANDR